MILNMKINKELIDRYLQNACTAREREIVESWLASSAAEDTALTGDELENMSKHIWASLENYLPGCREPIRLRWWNGLPRLAAAACLLAGMIGLSFFFVYKNADTPIALSSYGMQDGLKGAVRQISFSLQPNSSVNGSISRYQGYLNFTGSLKMISGAGSDLQIDFGVGENTNQLSRKAIIEEGQMYYVGLLKQADVPDEILILNREQLEDVPPRIKIMAFDSYDI